MALEFKFSAKRPDGRVVKGKVKAESEMDVRAKLRAGNYEPLSVKQASAEKKSLDLFKKPVSGKEFQLFLRQLSILLKSGVPLLESLKSLRESSFSSGLGDILADVIKDVEEGRSFSEALQKHKSVFNTMVVNLVKAGEEGGILDEVLARIAIFYEKRAKLQAKVKGALMYPVVTILVAIGALTAILVFVIPKFQSMFASQGKELPGMTKFVVALSELFINNWYIVLFLMMAIPLAIVSLYKAGIIRNAVDEIMVRIPLFGSLIRKSVVARMSRTLSTLLTSGIRINDGINVTIGTMGNVVVDRHLNNINEEVITGKPFSEALRRTNFFPKIVAQMISIGEQTGNLDTMLEKVADFYEEEVENAAEQLTNLLEPLVIVLLGGMIGFLVVAMFLPIFSLGDVIG